MCLHVIAGFRGLPFPILIVSFFDCETDCNVVSEIELRRSYKIVSKNVEDSKIWRGVEIKVIQIRYGGIQFSIVPDLKVSVFMNYIYTSILLCLCLTNVSQCFIYTYFSII